MGFGPLDSHDCEHLESCSQDQSGPHDIPCFLAKLSLFRIRSVGDLLEAETGSQMTSASVSPSIPVPGRRLVGRSARAQLTHSASQEGVVGRCRGVFML
jgi:hypothetical protein